MIKVVDANGSVVNGLYRNEHGAIVVDNPEQYDRYLTQQAIKNRDANTINELRNEVSELKAIVEKLLSR